jgi:hypothetical protein
VRSRLSVAGPANDRVPARLRDVLGPAAFDAARSAGSALSIDRAVEEVLGAGAP